MKTHDLLERISSDHEVCHGQPAIRGTRLIVSQILGLMAGGESMETVLALYPYISREDILACLALGAALANFEDVEIGKAS